MTRTAVAAEKAVKSTSKKKVETAGYHRSKKTSPTFSPVIFRLYRLIQAFAESDPENRYYVDVVEGALLVRDLSKTDAELQTFDQCVSHDPGRFLYVEEMTFYENRKLKEWFVTEKVYDNDIKEKLTDIIQSNNSFAEFNEFMSEHAVELEKWAQFFYDRFRIRIIEWLRESGVKFVFEEDLLTLSKDVIESVRAEQFTEKGSKEVMKARVILEERAQLYYSNEALNPRPKRGRPPKQLVKEEDTVKFSREFFLQLPAPLIPFRYLTEPPASPVDFVIKQGVTPIRGPALRFSETENISNNLEQVAQRLASLPSFATKIGGVAAALHEQGELDGSDAMKKLQSKIKSSSDQPKEKTLASLFKGATRQQPESNRVQETKKVSRITKDKKT